MQRRIEFDEGWEIVQKGITKLKGILDNEPGVTPMNSEVYITMYTTIYNMCTQKPPYDYSKQIYEKYGEVFFEYIHSKVLPSLAEKHDEFKLRELVQRWANHKVMLRWMSHFFLYLDHYYVVRNCRPNLKEVGLACFRYEVYGQVKAEARASVISLIEKEREGECFDRALLKNLIAVFVENGKEGDMATYEEDFEEHMLRETGEYYSLKASIWVVEDTCSKYMLKTEECLKKERERASHYLLSRSEPKLLEKVQHELLVVYDTQILDKEESGCRVLLQNDKLEDLSRIYRLYINIPIGLEPVASVFREHVTNEGKALVQQAEEAVVSSNQQASSGAEQYGLVLIQKLIELHDKYLGYVTGCFMNHSLFHKALKQALEVVCDKSVAGSSSVEMLAAFCDNILKMGGSKLSEEAVKETLEKVVTLLVYISDKDLFAEFCRKKLARRLLFNRNGSGSGSGSEDREKSLLTKLKQQCGGQFTSQMEGMITDLTVGKESITRFGEFILEKNRDPVLNLSVQVLTTGYWPSYKSSDLNLPEDMVKCVEVFKDFFNREYKRRKLPWIYSLGSCNVEGKFDSKTIELVVTTHQAALLLLFNNAEKLSFSEISTQLNLTKDELIRLLHSLSCAKYKILLKEPSTKTISPSDTFMLNSRFTYKMRKIRIPMPPLDERKKVTEDVDKDRKFAIDAAIVKIMKSRKVLGHQQLVMECVEILKGLFKPDIKAIKKRIKDLITREYLERDMENPVKPKYKSSSHNYMFNNNSRRSNIPLMSIAEAIDAAARTRIKMRLKSSASHQL